ncbi:MAG: hypothetical protein ACREJQ_03880 [bacterium]
MTKLDAAKLACRFIAITFLPSMVFILMDALNHENPEPIHYRLVLFCYYALASAALWIGADRIGNFMTAEDGPLTARASHGLAIAVLGLYILVKLIPEATYLGTTEANLKGNEYFRELGSEYWRRSVLANRFELGATLVLGIAFFRGWRWLLNRIHKAPESLGHTEVNQP